MPDRLDRDPLVVLADEGEDGLAFGRWCLQERQVADAHERHLEGARNRCRRQRQDVDVRLELLDLLLVLDPEALLLVDDEETEVFEPDVAGQQAVGSDHAIDLAVAQTLLNHLGLARREESRQHLDTDRVAGEPVGEGVAVLCGEQRGRREDSDLLAALDGFERGADRDLGLAESDVAADEAVHRVGPLHVGFDVVDRRGLVGGLDVREGLFHLPLPRCVLAERVPLGIDPLLVEHHQLLGDLVDLGPHTALRLGEVGAAEPVQRRCLTTDVLAQRVDLVGRDVQPVAAFVRDEQVVVFDAADRALDHALVLADTVLVVHDVHACLQVLERRCAFTAAGPRLAVGALAAR